MASMNNKINEFNDRFLVNNILGRIENNALVLVDIV